MKQIVKRYLTLNPKMLSSRELKYLVGKLHRSNEADFCAKLPGLESEMEEY